MAGAGADQVTVRGDEQGDDQVVYSGQPPLLFGDDSRLETGIPVPRHREFHRPGLGEHRLIAVAISLIAAIAACRVVLGVAEMVIQLALEGALHDHFRQFPEQAALTGELQPAGPGSFGKLTQQLLISRRQLRARLALVVRHVSRWCLLRLGSYTVEITVPTTTRTAACLAAGTVKGLAGLLEGVGRAAIRGAEQPALTDRDLDRYPTAPGSLLIVRVSACYPVSR